MALDLQCVVWLLQTSLDKTFHLAALCYLAAMPELGHVDSSLVIRCFNVFISCFNDTPVVVPGLGRLAMLSASCFLRALRRFFATDPTSRTLVDLRRRYNKFFPLDRIDFTVLQFRYTMISIHILFNYSPPEGWWGGDRPSDREYIELVGCVVDVAQVVYQRTLNEEVPRWMLRFVFDSLFLDPSPPTPVVADCLKVIAIDLGCDFSNTGKPDERCVQI